MNTFTVTAPRHRSRFLRAALALTILAAPAMAHANKASVSVPSKSKAEAFYRHHVKALGSPGGQRITSRTASCQSPKRGAAAVRCSVALTTANGQICSDKDVKVSYRSRRNRHLVVRGERLICTAITAPTATQPAPPSSAPPLPLAPPGGGTPPPMVTPSVPPVTNSVNEQAGSRYHSNAYGYQWEYLFQKCSAPYQDSGLPGWWFQACTWTYVPRQNTNYVHYYYWSGTQWMPWFGFYYDGLGNIYTSV